MPSVPMMRIPDYPRDKIGIQADIFQDIIILNGLNMQRII